MWNRLLRRSKALGFSSDDRGVEVDLAVEAMAAGEVAAIPMVLLEAEWTLVVVLPTEPGVPVPAVEVLGLGAREAAMDLAERAIQREVQGPGKSRKGFC